MAHENVMVSVDLGEILAQNGSRAFVDAVLNADQLIGDDAATTELIELLTQQLGLNSSKFLSDEFGRRIRAHMKWERENEK